MKCLLVHNHYQCAGGEDSVFEDEATLLQDRGHDVVRYTVHNDSIREGSRWKVAKNTVWNRRVHAELKALMLREKPDVMHCTNTFPLISPAAYYAARAAGVPVVQSLHNYRILCASSLLMRDGAVCEKCVGRSLGLPGVIHGCYRGSRAGSAVVAALQSVHWALGTWTRMVDAYIVLNEFAREKFIAGGLPVEKLYVKPNFVHPDPRLGAGRGGYAIFVGRLSQEKGISTLLAAWRDAPGGVPLKIVGDGPESDAVRQAARDHSHVEWLGRLPRDEVQALVAEAAVLVLPSTCYEGNPKTVIEAFASGTPVVGSRLGGIAEAVTHGRTGRLFTPGDASELAAQVAWIAAHPAEVAEMRRAARAEFEAKYQADANYKLLLSVYSRVLGRELAAEAPANPVIDEPRFVEHYTLSSGTLA